MKRRYFGLLLATLLMALALAACGDNSATVSSAGTAGASSSGNSGGSGGSNVANNSGSTNMSGMNMTPGANMTTMPANTQAVEAAGTPGAAMGNMPGMTMGMGDEVKKLQGLNGKDFEVAFMQDMIAHHQQATMLSQLVPSNTKRPELLKLSTNIISSQTKEINDMSDWLVKWFDVKPAANPQLLTGQNDTSSLDSPLKNLKDAQFDEAYVKMMLDHHQQAVDMAKLLPGKTKRPELLGLGENIVKTQGAEIEQMKNWQKT